MLSRANTKKKKKNERKKKDVFFIIGDWNAKNRKSRDTQNNRQRLTEFCQEIMLVTANTLFQEHKRRLYTWVSPYGQHQNQIDYILCSQDGEALYSQKKQDLELTVAQITNSLSQNSGLY